MYEPNMDDGRFEELIENRAPFTTGGSREVYNVPSNNKVVIKKLHILFPMSNMIEWAVWRAIMDSPLRDLFGECLSVSKTGRFLMMERVSDFVDERKPPMPTFPIWVTDRKPNFIGRALDGKVKVRDYGWVNLGVVLVPTTAYLPSQFA